MPTRFTGANDEARGVAGLWALWKNPQTSLWELSFTMLTMLTINADTHPRFKEMHRPDLKRPPEQRDKRMVVILPEPVRGMARRAGRAPLNRRPIRGRRSDR